MNANIDLYRPMTELFRDTIINNKPYRNQSIKNLVKEHFNHMVKPCQYLNENIFMLTFCLYVFNVS